MTQSEFAKIMERYERLVFTVIYRLTGDWHESQNLTQETFLSAYAHIDRCDSDSYQPWLTRIASNKAKDWLKSAYHRRVLLDKGNDDGEENRNFLETGRPLSGTAAEEPVFRGIETAEGVTRIRQEVMALKEPYHKVAVLFFLEERPVEEIAEALRRPKKTVQTQLYRARRILQECLKEEDAS